jgi:hypothetical protein
MSDTRLRSATLLLGVLMLVIGMAGCGKPTADEGYEKVEHFVPLHWPKDLEDAAAKIAERASQLSGQAGAETVAIESQLRDIVGWVPEIAADTDLTEQQWNPVYEASEALSKRLAKMRRPLDDATLGAIDDFCKLLVDTHQLLPPDEPVSVDEPVDEDVSAVQREASPEVTVEESE